MVLAQEYNSIILWAAMIYIQDFIHRNRFSLLECCTSCFVFPQPIAESFPEEGALRISPL